jgi:hypothetical protein
MNLCFACPSHTKLHRGRVAEWLMAPVLKTGVPERVSGVRIPPLPPFCLSGLRVAIRCGRDSRKSPKIEFYLANLRLQRGLPVEPPGLRGRISPARSVGEKPGRFELPSRVAGYRLKVLEVVACHRNPMTQSGVALTSNQSELIDPGLADWLDPLATARAFRWC